MEVLETIGYALVSMYGLLMTIAPIILVRLYDRGTGLQWDPVLVADQSALLQNPDVRALSAHLETCSYAEYRMTMKRRAETPVHLNWGIGSTGSAEQFGVE